MTANVACSVSGCKNPVIGQCAGYQQPCGKFYCALHTSGSLCDECSRRKVADDLAAAREAEFEAAMKTLQKQSNNRGCLNLLFAGLLYLIGIVFVPILPSPFGSGNNGTIMLAIAYGVICIVILVIRGVATRRQLVEAAKKVNENKPGFLEWYKKKRSEQMWGSLALGGLVIAGILAAAASESDRDARIRKAVNEEIDKRN